MCEDDYTESMGNDPRIDNAALNRELYFLPFLLAVCQRLAAFDVASLHGMVWPVWCLTHSATVAVSSSTPVSRL